MLLKGLSFHSVSFSFSLLPSGFTDFSSLSPQFHLIQPISHFLSFPYRQHQIVQSSQFLIHSDENFKLQKLITFDLRFSKLDSFKLLLLPLLLHLLLLQKLIQLLYLIVFQPSIIQLFPFSPLLLLHLHFVPLPLSNS